MFENNAIVRITGLTGRTDLNGTIGFVRKYDENKERYAVEIELRKFVAVRKVNLEVDTGK